MTRRLLPVPTSIDISEQRSGTHHKAMTRTSVSGLWMHMDLAPLFVASTACLLLLENCSDESQVAYWI